jgi:hypothetical protein
LHFTFLIFHCFGRERGRKRRGDARAQTVGEMRPEKSWLLSGAKDGFSRKAAVLTIHQTEHHGLLCEAVFIHKLIAAAILLSLPLWFIARFVQRVVRRRRRSESCDS